MKNHNQKIKKSQGAVIIKIAPGNWHVTGTTNVRICQQPAKIISWPVPPPLRLPRLDIWQLDEFLSAPKQQIF